MKQYCEFCQNASGYDNYVYCSVGKGLKTEQSAKALNSCKFFEFCEQSVFDENKLYKPRGERKQKVKDGEQIKLGVEKND